MPVLEVPKVVYELDFYNLMDAATQPDLRRDRSRSSRPSSRSLRCIVSTTLRSILIEPSEAPLLPLDEPKQAGLGRLMIALSKCTTKSEQYGTNSGPIRNHAGSTALLSQSSGNIGILDRLNIPPRPIRPIREAFWLDTRNPLNLLAFQERKKVLLEGCLYGASELQGSLSLGGDCRRSTEKPSRISRIGPQRRRLHGGNPGAARVSAVWRRASCPLPVWSRISPVLL